MDEARARRLTLIACILGSSIVFVDQIAGGLIAAVGIENPRRAEAAGEAQALPAAS
jgi:hypothetical protein